MSGNPFARLAHLAILAHERGEITRESLTSILQGCINGTAAANGYADQYGMPFPEHPTARPTPRKGR